jgi:hypothetical protein
MKRSMCGLVVLAVATGVWSCNGDPTDSIRGNERVLADPASVFVGEGESEFLTVEMVDDQGNQLASDFDAQNVGAGITVEKDTTYLRTTIGTRLETSTRFIVTGLEPVATTFELVSGSQTITIPVKVVPASFAATFSNPAPAQNEPLTVTAEPGYKFAPSASITFGGDPAVVVSRAPDSTSFTFVPPPAPAATRAIGTVTGVVAPNIPGVALVVPTVDSITVPFLDTIAGAEAPGSAPVIPTPLPGQASAFFDAGDFTGLDVTGDGGLGARYYQFTVTEPGIYTVAVDWDGGADMDMVLCTDAACTPDNNSFLGAGASHPESVDFDLVAGTYRVAAVLFSGAAPPRVDITIRRPAP